MMKFIFDAIAWFLSAARQIEEKKPSKKVWLAKSIKINITTLVLLLLASSAPAQVIRAHPIANWGIYAGATSNILELKGPTDTDFGIVGTFAPNVTTATYMVQGKQGDPFCVRVRYLNSIDPTKTVIGEPVCMTLDYVYVQLVGANTAQIVCTGTPGQSVLPSRVVNSGGLNPLVSGQDTNVLFNGRPCMTPGQLCQ